MYYHFKIHKDNDGYWSECLELNGCLTQGDNIEDLIINIKDVLNLYLSEPAESKIKFALPNENIRTSKDVIKVKVDPNVAFSHYLRILRLEHKMTQKETAKKLGLKHLYSYQRLESSKKANPELKTLEKIKEVFPEFDLNIVL